MSALPDEVEAQFAAIERANQLANDARQGVMDNALDTSAAMIAQLASISVTKAALGGPFRGDSNSGDSASANAGSPGSLTPAS